MIKHKQISDGTYWIHGRYEVGRSQYIHSSVYVIKVNGEYILIDSGDLPNRDLLKSEIMDVTDSQGITSMFITKSHMPHSANVASFANEWDVDNVIFPGGLPKVQGFPRVLQWPANGCNSYSGRDFLTTQGPLIDIPHTTWLLDQETGVFFTSDGFCYYHQEENKDCLSDELGGFRLDDVQGFYSDILLWLEYANSEKVISELEQLLGKHNVDMIAPAHGNPIVKEDIDEYVTVLSRAIENISR